MRQLESKVKVSPKVFTPIAIAVVGSLILGGLGYRLHGQQQTLGNLQKQIQSLPSTVPPEKRVELEKDRITLENTLFGTLVQTVGGLLLFITAYVSYQNLKATQKNVVVAEEKQVTERFTQAINQLGSEKIEVRLGGIYALERIAKDSAKDHWTIMEVLTAFVRERSPALNLKKSNPKQTLLTDFLPQSQPSEDSAHPKIATDVQAALTVIKRRDRKKEEPHQRINLSQTYLSGTDLSGTYFSYANFRDTDLSGAKLKLVDLSSAFLENTNLNGAKLIGANLSSAYLNDADIRSANFRGADLSGAHLGDANLSNASLHRANLSSADLSGAILTSADFSGANLSSAVLAIANLSNAKFSGANLTDAKLIFAHISGAYFSRTNLTSADFNNADLSNAYFSDANFSDANLTEANLTEANLTEAKNWTEKQLAAAKLCRTTLPEGCNLNPDRDCEALSTSINPNLNFFTIRLVVD